MEIIGIGLGSNLGERADMLRKAIGFLGEIPLNSMQISSVFETQPWGFFSENTFYNMVILAQTSLTPHQILQEVLRIEQLLGRTRFSNQYSDRPIDLDILFLGSQVFHDAQLEIPHPRMQARRFVLEPLQELSPFWQHPITGVFIDELLSQCIDKPIINKGQLF